MTRAIIVALALGLAACAQTIEVHKGGTLNITVSVDDRDQVTVKTRDLNLDGSLF